MWWACQGEAFALLSLYLAWKEYTEWSKLDNVNGVEKYVLGEMVFYPPRK